MGKITPFLWFDARLQDVVAYYTSIFKNCQIISHDQSMAVFVIEGQEFMALNGGPMFKFNEAVSFVVTCENQAEVDFYWNALSSNGGREGKCAWLKDKYGVSWQIVPDALTRYLRGPDQASARRVMTAMLNMRKIIIADLDLAAKSG